MRCREVPHFVLNLLSIKVQEVFISFLSVFLDQQESQVSEEADINVILESHQKVCHRIEQVKELVDMVLRY